MSAADASVPVLLLAFYDPGALYVMWRPVTTAGLSGYRVYVRIPGSDPQTFDAGPSDVSLTPPVTATQIGGTVTVAALIDGVPGTESAPLPILIQAPVVLLMVYDTSPASSLWAQWRPVTQGGVTGYVAVLDEVGTSNQWTQQPTDTTTSFAQTLDPQQVYQFTLRATASDGAAQGPASTPLTAIAATPAIQLTTYDLAPQAEVWAQWRPVTTAPAAAYLAVLQQSGTSNAWRQTPTDPQTSFLQTLDPATTYTLTIRATDAAGVSQGPASPAVTVITQTQTVQALTYDLTPQSQLSASWSAATQPEVAGWVAVLDEVGTSNQWTAHPGTPSCAFQQTLSDAQSYTLTVRATDATGISQGPSTTPLQAITAVTTLSELDYDSAVMTVSWAQIAGTAGYAVAVAKNSGTPQVYPAGAVGTLPIPGALDPQATYAVTVRLADATSVVTGPASAPLSPLTSSPGAPGLAFTGTQLVATWTADSEVGVTGYIARLDKNGAPATSSPSSTLTTSFDDTLTANTLYACQVRSTGDRVKGPWTDPPTPGPYRSEAITTYDGLGRLTALAFTGSGGTAYSYDAFGNITQVATTTASQEETR